MVWWCCGGASSAKKPIGIRTEDRARLNVTFDTGVMCWLSPKNRLSDAKVQPDMQLLSVLLSFWRYFPFFSVSCDVTSVSARLKAPVVHCRIWRSAGKDLGFFTTFFRFFGFKRFFRF